MGYEVKPDGSIIAPDEAAALRLSRRIREEAAKATLKPAHAHKRPRTANGGGLRPEVQEKVTRLLRFTAAAGADGVDSKPLAKHMGVEPKGISPYRIVAIRLIKEKAPNEDPEKVVWREKTRDGTKWFANVMKLKELGLI